MRFEVRRLGTWLPPFAFGSFSLLLVVAAPDGGSRAFYAVLAAVMSYWFVRSWRVAVELRDDELVVRGQIRTRRYRWSEIRGAGIAPMRTMSPFAARWPYVALELDIADGRRQFEEISASESHRSKIESIAAAIDARVSGG